MAKISVLLASRKNSKYLAKFFMGLLHRTHDMANIEVLTMLNKDDTWNSELVSVIADNRPNVRFFWEDSGLGRAGLHTYFNELAQWATGDWIIYFCEDHFIIMDGWDKYILDTIEAWQLDPQKVWTVIPKFDNIGAMNQIISRGYYNALGYVGRNGWIDSYLNDVNEQIPQDRIRHLPYYTFTDFTHYQPSPMADEMLQARRDEGAIANLPKYDSDENRRLIAEDAEKLSVSIRREA